MKDMIWWLSAAILQSNIAIWFHTVWPGVFALVSFLIAGYYYLKPERNKDV